jgi:hypothetical protein
VAERKIMSCQSGKAGRSGKRTAFKKTIRADSAEKPGGVVVPACESAGKDQQRARPSSSEKANFLVEKAGQAATSGFTGPRTSELG